MKGRTAGGWRHVTARYVTAAVHLLPWRTALRSDESRRHASGPTGSSPPNAAEGQRQA